MLPNKGFFDIFRSHLRMRNLKDVFRGGVWAFIHLVYKNLKCNSLNICYIQEVRAPFVRHAYYGCICLPIDYDLYSLRRSRESTPKGLLRRFVYEFSVILCPSITSSPKEGARLLFCPVFENSAVGGCCLQSEMEECSEGRPLLRRDRFS